MATNAGIVTGKQYIRFAETLNGDASEVFEYRPVYFQGGNDFGSTIQGTDAAGISQYYVDSLVNTPTSSRLLSVATSGLLLVEADSAGAGAITINQQLNVDAQGRAIAAGTPITIGGKVPYVREVIQGQRSFVLVSV
jgi:hypothetical protein